MSCVAPAEPLWVFLHLPKTGGTTFKAHLERHLEQDVSLIELSDWGRQIRRKAGRPELAERSEEDRAKVRVIAGHHAYYGIHRLIPGPRDVRYVSFMRDPAERCVSLYNFRRSRGVVTAGFEQWYESDYQRESAVRFFAERLTDRRIAPDPERQLAVARQLLERCWFVTTTERLDEGLDFLCAEMDIPADWKPWRQTDGGTALSIASHPARGERVERHQLLDEALRARIHAESPCDLALYEWVKAGRWPRSG